MPCRCCAAATDRAGRHTHDHEGKRTFRTPANPRAMREDVLARLRTALDRARRVERREVGELRAWLEHTGNLVHVSVLVFVPLLVGLVTFLSNATAVLPFLLFPPLASGTYTLFAHPEERYASPRRFVVGLTTGAVCGWLALWGAGAVGLGVSPGDFQVPAGVAAFAVLLTGVVTWALDAEEPSAYSTALLVPFVDLPGIEALPREYVASVLLSTLLVAGVFVVWRDRVYEQRSRYLYRSTTSDDHVLVPMRGDHRMATLMLGARLAAAHEAGKVVLLDAVDDAALAQAERDVLADRAVRTDGGPPAGDGEAVAADSPAERRAAEDVAADLERRARHVETKIGVPCEVVVAVGDDAGTVAETARRTNCDLVVTPYEERHGALSPFVRGLFAADVDVLAHRSAAGRTGWKRVLVPVRRSGEVAHHMVDFARRLVGASGRVAVATCIDSERRRRGAESMLADLVETFAGDVETRVSRADVEDFIADNQSQYDLVVLGSSGGRSTASRFVSPPTFERIRELDADVAVLDRGFPG